MVYFHIMYSFVFLVEQMPDIPQIVQLTYALSVCLF